MIVAAALAVALVAGCGDRQQQPPSGTAARCGPVEEQPDGGHSHLVGDTDAPVDYLTVPPTSGWHFRDPDRIHDALAVHGPADPLTETEQASVVAVDLVVIAHRGLPDDEREALERLAVGEYDGRVAVTPYERLEPGQVALAAWRRLQICEGVDVAVVSAFVDEYAADEPDLGMGEEHGGH